MPVAARRRPAVTLLCTALATVSLAVAMPGWRTARAGDCLAGTLADEFTADRMGLVREWIIQIPSLAPGRTLENVVAGDGLVVASTSDGLVHAIQAAPTLVASGTGAPLPGTLLWSRAVGRAGGRFEQAGIGTDLVAVCQDKETYGLARETGLESWHETDKNLAATGPAVIGDWVYAPNGDGMTRFAVHPLRQPTDEEGATAPAATRPAGSPAATAKPSAKTSAKKTKKAKKRQESLLPADIDSGGVVAYQPVPFHEGVLWCTTDGLLVTLQSTDVDWQRLEFALENPPAGPPTVRDRRIFAATTNGDLARIDIPETGKMTRASQLQLVWHAVLPGPAESSAFVAGDTVVVSLGDLGIAAYSADTGSLLWQSCVSGTIVSVGGDRVWLFDRVGRLSSLHIADGLRRETLCLGPFTMPLVNLRDDRLLLASPSGMIVSLVPRRPATTASPAGGDTAPRPQRDAGTDASEEAMEKPAEEMTGPDAGT